MSLQTLYSAQVVICDHLDKHAGLITPQRLSGFIVDNNGNKWSLPNRFIPIVCRLSAFQTFGLDVRSFRSACRIL